MMSGFPKNYTEAQVIGAANRALALKKRAEIEQQPGGLDAFLAGVRIEPILSEDEQKVFKEFYSFDENGRPPRRELMQKVQKIEKSFDKRMTPYFKALEAGILPDELVPQEACIVALGQMDYDPQFHKEIGPYHYQMLGVRDARGKPIGVIAAEVFCHKEGPASIHSSYYALLPEYRAMGIGRIMQKALAKRAVDYVAKTRPEALACGYILEFIEANDISKMSLGGRLMDEAMSLHPLVREEMWERRDFREIPDIDFKMRDDPPIPLALKVRHVDVRLGADGKYKAVGTTPPKEVSSDAVLRHVSGFDNVLMNYDAMKERLRKGEPLLDPRAEGIVSLPESDRLLRTVSVGAAKAKRQAWGLVEWALKKLNKKESLPLDETMQSLREKYASDVEIQKIDDDLVRGRGLQVRETSRLELS